jgi:hypothetical protein
LEANDLELTDTAPSPKWLFFTQICTESLFKQMMGTEHSIVLYYVKLTSEQKAMGS